MNKGGLGKGLGSLIPNKLTNEESAQTNIPISTVADTDERVKKIKLEKIETNPLQPRKHFDYSDLEDLVNSIKEHGILQPLIVSPLPDGKYQLIAGERRFRAAQTLELETVPCLVRNVKDLEKLELALIENVQRANLNPIEESLAYNRLVCEFSLTQEEVGKKVGKKRTTISNALRLLDLPDEIQEALKSNKLTAGHAKAILALGTEAERLKLFKKILKMDLSVRGTEGEVKKIKVSAKGGPTSGRKTSENNLEISEKEEALRNALNTKVSINKKGDSGSITIDFYSTEELNEIVKKIV